MLSGLSEAIAAVLAWFYSLVPSYGLAIIMLTVAVMIVLTPLTLKGTRSMMEMQRLQPELKRIQAKHKGDREKLNQEMMAFYKEHNINPVGGCLPLLVQMPVFIILFQVLRGITIRCGGLGSGTGSIAAESELDKPLTSWILTDQVFCPDNLSSDTAMYQALHTSSSMDFLGIDLSLSASNALQQSFVTFLPYLVLIIIVLVSSIIQQRQIQGRQTGSQVSSQQQAIMKFMPYLLPVFSFGFSAGLVLYFVVSNVYRIGQQAWITRSMHARGLIDTTAKEKPKEKSVGKSALSDGGKGGSKGRGGTRALPSGSQSNDGGRNKPAAGGKTGRASGARKGRTSAQPQKKPGKSAKSQALQRKEAGPAAEPNRKGRSDKAKPGTDQPPAGESRTRSGQPRSRKKKR
ncbi:MAG: Membrane protein insertase YidC [Acidimicrobiales bacterium]|nr:MAG: membrane protein insertase YidC [Actinomycetota bacterium]MBV6509768.1 Membrane protein insertase YidC [Acidimicrobiales bacterium]RIK04839.1 MAG: hypothetical protein DCC48_12415 [Acidobacteriota bacterium]